MISEVIPFFRMYIFSTCLIVAFLLGGSLAQNLTQAMTETSTSTAKATEHSTASKTQSLNLSEVKRAISQVSLIPVCNPLLNKIGFVLPLWSDLANAYGSLLLKDSDFTKCPDGCSHGGVCHFRAQESTFQCVCPLDYTGLTCAKSALPRLTACTESTCENGGHCSGTSENPSCSCPANTHGSLCERRTRYYRISFSIAANGKPIPWNADYEVKTSAIYQKMSAISRNLVHHAMRLGNDEFLVRSYVNSNFVHFANGTTDPVVDVGFELSDSSAMDHSVRCILGQLISGVARLLNAVMDNNLLTAADSGGIVTDSFTIGAVNPCSTGNNDCARNALCLLTSPSVYTCVCKSFAIDVSKNDKYPGRRCLYDGLIIFTFAIVGLLLCTLIIVFLGCRRTIWYRFKYRLDPERHELVQVPANYAI